MHEKTYTYTYTYIYIFYFISDWLLHSSPLVFRVTMEEIIKKKPNRILSSAIKLFRNGDFKDKYCKCVKCIGSDIFSSSEDST